jgi:GT2 family glycosyltransferase
MTEEPIKPLSVVIPTYNAVGQVESLLTRLAHFREKYRDDFEVIVADDGSTDGTAEEVRRRCPDFTVVANKQNRGYAANVMSGAAVAQHEYLATLNSDIELLGNPFKALQDELAAHSRMFAAMPLIYNRALDKVENLARLYCHRGLVWHTELAEEAQWSGLLRDLFGSASDIKQRVRDLGAEAAPIRSVLCGAAFVCRRDEFLKLGGLDLRYQPFYWEDVDLDYRARRLGHYSAVVPRAMVLHRHSESISRYHGSKKLGYLRLNQLRFILAHRDQLPELTSPRWWWLLRAIREVFRGDPAMHKAYLSAALGAREL